MSIIFQVNSQNLPFSKTILGFKGGRFVTFLAPFSVRRSFNTILGDDILQGQREPARSFEMEPLDIKAIRKQFTLSQSQFATLLGVSVKTLQNWEQGHRKPDSAAQLLRWVAAKYPETVWDVAQSMIIKTS